MRLLPDADADGSWPVHAAALPVVPRRCGVVVGPFPIAGSACLVLTDWMETVRETVAAHASWFVELDRDSSLSSVA